MPKYKITLQAELVTEIEADDESHAKDVAHDFCEQTYSNTFTHQDQNTLDDMVQDIHVVKVEIDGDLPW